MNEPYVFTLSNGIRVCYQQVENTRLVHCGIVIDVGSRDEDESTQGITHFWEHMAFKGTAHRRSYHILTSVDSVGGELNAFTDKEKVVFFATVRENYFERAVDVLADITFHSIFPENQIEKERGVILEEMAMYFDNPEDSLQDEFESILYRNHPLGMNILGRPETILNFKRKDFLTFYKGHMDTGRIVFSCVGHMPVATVEKIVQRYLNVKPMQRIMPRVKYKGCKAQVKELIRPVKQARYALGRAAYPVRHPRRIPFFLLVNMLGGPGMNSRLNMALREKHGYVYSIDAHYMSYTDTGMFAVFFGTEPKQLDRCIKLVRQELDKFCDAKLSDRQLRSAKEQLVGQLAVAEENNLSLMIMMGKSLLDTAHIPSLDEVFSRIMETDATLLQDIASDMFDPEKMSSLAMLPAIKKR
jgi:predicted Zn-dependent peptidase